MAEAVATKGPKYTVSTMEIPLEQIVDNSGQSRGMGVLPALAALGYGVFEKTSVDKDPILTMLKSADPAEKKQVLSLIEEHEPELVRLGQSRRFGQLEPIGAHETSAGYDVLYGMRRYLADLYIATKYGDKERQTIEAKVFAGKLTSIEKRLMALEENDNREDESPIDRAITYNFLKEEGGLSFEEIGKKTRQSDQNVRNHVKLLDQKLEDKRMAIHTRRLSVDAALKLLAQRRGKGKGSDVDRSGGGKSGNRFRLRGIKNYLKAYDAERKPSGWDKEEWELFTKPDVRAYFALKLGLKYTEYVEPPPEEKKSKKSKEETNGEEPAKKGKTLKVPRNMAVKLLVSLGKAGAATWNDDTLGSKLEGVVNILEDGQKAETPNLQKLLDKLVVGYKDGLQVEIISKDEK